MLYMHCFLAPAPGGVNYCIAEISCLIIPKMANTKARSE